MTTRFLFVGERRSPIAIKMNVTWENGRLAAKQLFDALSSCGISGEKQIFVNLFVGQKGCKINREIIGH